MSMFSNARSIRNLLAIVLGIGFFATAMADQCPATITYNQSMGYYDATSNGILWKSQVRMGFDPTPAITRLDTIATGDQASAMVICEYQVGNNKVSLQSNTRFVLDGADWQSTGDSLYFCKQGNPCSFHPE